MPNNARTRRRAQQLLGQFFSKNGYVRVPDRERMKNRTQDPDHEYKKGYEVRLVAQNEEELEQIRRLLEEAGFHPAKPFKKGKQIIQPIYGKQALLWFLAQDSSKADLLKSLSDMLLPQTRKKN